MQTKSNAKIYRVKKPVKKLTKKQLRKYVTDTV